MDIAALILSIVSLIMSGTLLVIFLAKNVFSSHAIQMVPVDTFMPSGTPRAVENDYMEFDAPTAMDIATEAKLKKAH
jgi:hypothetical protein